MKPGGVYSQDTLRGFCLKRFRDAIGVFCGFDLYRCVIIASAKNETQKQAATNAIIKYEVGTLRKSCSLKEFSVFLGLID